MMLIIFGRKNLQSILSELVSSDYAVLLMNWKIQMNGYKSITGSLSFPVWFYFRMALTMQIVLTLRRHPHESHCGYHFIGSDAS